VIVAWLARAAWGLEPATVQALAELEWRRSDPLPILTQIADADAETRAVGARALGRLRDPEALPALSGLADDLSEPVRVAVAEALGATPGATDLVRERLSQLVPPSGPGPRAHAADGEMAALLDALGRQGTVRDLGPVLSALREPWPIGAAAARALGRMGVRKVPALDDTVAPLVARLGASDPRLVADVGWALSRIGLSAASHADVEVVWRKVRSGTMPETRAWLLKAVWPVLSRDQQSELFVDAATEPSRLVRVALFSALRTDDVGGVVIAPFLADPDPWVRSSVISALGRIGDAEARAALSRHAAECDDPFEVAAAIEARGIPASDVASDLEEPSVVRGAAVTTLAGDVETLVAFALEGDPQAVRSAAAGTLIDDDDTGGAVGVRLLKAADPAVREAGVELVVRLGPADRAEALLGLLAVEPTDEVMAVALAALGDVIEQDPKAVRANDPAARLALDRAAAHAGLRVQTETQRVARLLGLPLGEAAKPGWAPPDLGDVGRVRGAVVTTSEGKFRIALDPDAAPLAVANFTSLAEQGFFDGLVWHRVVPGFVAQTGCPRGDGWGGPGYAIPDEVSSFPFDVGAVGMARAAPDTGGSQWFVTTSDQPHLVGEYTRFGEVVEGLYVVRRLRQGSELLHVEIERIGP
jgi:cyclophilin family peptidyl-prolyl cis-trans isomerase/HEAT repeat protein